MQAVMGMDVGKFEGFEIDSDFDPIPVSPSEKIVASLAAANEETLLIRGKLDEEKEDEVKALPNVENVWTDARIEPFDQEYSGKSGEDFSMPEPEELDICFEVLEEGGEVSPFTPELVSSPCPPTDCSPETAKGNIMDVVKYLRCDRLWAKGIRGKGIVIGICDTGVDKSKIPAVIGGWSPNSSYPPGTDPGGHGSMCATDALGMCPDAKIYDIGVLKNNDISGVTSDAISAFQWAINSYKAKKGPHILSNSWGMFQKSWAPDYCTDPNHPFTRKVVEAINTGIIVTFAAGNCGSQCPSWKCGSDSGPGKSIWGANGHPKVITVGAANILEQWIGYTSQGPASLDPKKPDFCAPSHFKGFYASDNGTSAANPVCAGVIGLLKSYDPDLKQEKVKEALQKTAKNLCADGWDSHSGYGMIQAEMAFNHLFLKPVPLVHAMWTHGSGIQVEYPANIKAFRRMGPYSLFEGKPGTSNWFHFAIPTPVIVSNKRLRLDSIILMFQTDADVTVRNVHIYDGHTKIQSYDGLSLTGSHIFERFDVKNFPVRFGIGISIGVSFGKKSASHRIAFVSAGGDFI